MILRQLHIINFKSIATASLSLSDKVNCFIGLNGMGKTNVLDALHYLSFVRSHLGVNDSLVVRRGTEAAVLEGLYSSDNGDDRTLLLQIRPGHKKVLKRNKKEYTRLSEHIGVFPLVIVSPQDYQLIQGGSEERRRFLDMQLGQQDPVYMGAISRYQALLEQRNSMLKADIVNWDLVDVSDMQMDRLATYIWQKRQSFVQSFIPQFQEYYSHIATEPEQVELSYTSHLDEHQGVLYSLLVQHREKDRLLGYTTVGVHRDDLSMSLGGEPIRKVGSEGQRKTFLISLKLAQYRLLARHSPERPILLLDDIFDKLDAERVGRIIRLVGGEDFGQIFITDTNRKYLDEIIQEWGEDFRLFSVDHGNITPYQI